jgi:hypothetical protein
MRHMNDPEKPSERLCLLITNDNTDIGAALRCLGVSLRVQVTRWQDDDYLQIISRLRPAVIVTEAAAIGWASDYAILIAALITDYRPTVVSLAPQMHAGSCAYLVARQIGAGAGIYLNSLADLDLDTS